MKSVAKILCFFLASTLWLIAGNSPFLLETGILVDPGENKLYLMSPEGHIELRDIAAGNLVWKTEEASQPLSLNGSELIALAEKKNDVGLEVVTLNANGRGQRRSTLPIPQRAWSSINKGPGKSLSVATTTQEDSVVFWWRSEDQDISGMARVQNPETLEGTLVWDKQSNNLENRVVSTPAPIAPKLRLLPPTDQVTNMKGVQWLSADGQHIMVSEKIANNSVWERYRWIIFDKTTKERLGEVTDHFSTASFFVTGNTLVYMARPYMRRVGNQTETKELRIRAINLQSGAEIWQRDVRDTTYRGTMPP